MLSNRTNCATAHRDGAVRRGARARVASNKHSLGASQYQVALTDMAEAPPAKQAMHRARVSADDAKLDGSELDGCWLITPDHYCKFCFDTHIHFQKHVDADTVVSKSVELSLLHPCFPCGLFSLLAWFCCPSIYLGLRRAPDADDMGKNSFDYIQVDGDAANAVDLNDLVSDHPDVVTRHMVQYLTKPHGDKKYHYAPGFERLGKSCNSSRRTILNAKNTLWTYSGKSQATLHPWNDLSWNLESRGFIPTEENASAALRFLFPKVNELKAVRCAPTCCMPTAFNRDRQLLAAYYSGTHRKDDRPVTAVEQEDKEACAATFAGALEVGNLPLIIRYRPVVGALKPEHALVLAGNGHLEALQWARNEGVEFPANICAAAASSGKLDVLKYCIENGAICDDDVVSSAMISESFECVEYCLETLKLPWGNETLLLALKISPEMLKYCLENGAPQDIRAIQVACRCTDLEAVNLFARSFHPFPHTPDEFELESATYYKKRHVWESIQRICESKGYSVKYSVISDTTY
jgi:hypothetical protein